MESLSYRQHFLKANVIWKLEETYNFRDAWAAFFLLSHQGIAEKHQDIVLRFQGETVLVTMWVHAEG